MYISYHCFALTIFFKLYSIIKRLFLNDTKLVLGENTDHRNQKRWQEHVFPPHPQFLWSKFSET